MADKAAVKKNKYFQWTNDRDVIMCREVRVREPYNYKLRSVERGQVWESIAQELNAIHQPSFRVTARSVRDRFSLLSTKHAQKIRDEEKASGIDVEETELDNLLEDISEAEKEAKQRLDAEDLEKKDKVQKERAAAAAAEAVREQALMGMNKRKNDDSNKEKKKKVRRSTAEVIEYLAEKSEKDREQKKEELEIRKREIELAATKQDQSHNQQQDMMATMLSQLQQQQQQQQAMQAMLIQQQQQQHNMFMSLMDKKL